jgi:RNA polymerase sigma-70 factor (ECF subfamily)
MVSALSGRMPPLPTPAAMAATPMSRGAHDEAEFELKPLWLRAQSGDEAAYRESLLRVAARLRPYFRRRLQHLPHEVEDLVQEVLLAVHLQRGTHLRGVPVMAWVMAIARHKLVDVYRRRGRREAFNQSLDDIDGEAVVAPEDGREAQRDLNALLEQLPPAQRVAILLTKVEGLSVLDAAQRTGASESAIKVQVHRGLKRLALLVRQA